MENASTIKFRCSSLSHIMTNDRSGKEMGDTAKTHLVDCYVSARYGRREEISGKALEKGTVREEDAITLLSRLQKKLFKKNTVRLSNDFISGECDIFLGEAITNADETYDTKCSWSAHTFFRTKMSKLNPSYYWQGQGYMWLTGAKKHTVAYCLINGLASAINNEKRLASYKSTAIDVESDPEYIKACKQIEINHIFDIKSFVDENPGFDFHNNVDEWKWDIPMEDRMFTFTVDRNEQDIAALKTRIEQARRWMDINLFKIYGEEG